MFTPGYIGWSLAKSGLLKASLAASGRHGNQVQKVVKKVLG
jgi:hypothetical protein